MGKTRETYLDVAKFAAMLTIVFIHVRLYAPAQADVWPIVGLENFVTTFVLPLFVLVSGYFSRGMFESCDRARLVRRLVACLWPVLTMTVLLNQLCGLAFYGRLAVPPEGWVRYVLSEGWFFFCLAICDCLTFFAQVVARRRKGVLAGVLLAEFAVLLALPVGLCHVRDMIPFFWFGLYAYPALRNVRFVPYVGLALLVGFAFACGLLPDFRTIGLNVHAVTAFGAPLSGQVLALFALRVLMGLAGALGVLSLVRLVTPLSSMVGVLSRFGSQTMGVFFLHIPLLVAHYHLVGWTPSGTFGRFAVALVIFLTAHGLAVLSHRNAVVGAVLWNPLALLKKRKKV